LSENKIFFANSYLKVGYLPEIDKFWR